VEEKEKLEFEEETSELERKARGSEVCLPGCPSEQMDSMAPKRPPPFAFFPSWED